MGKYDLDSVYDKKATYTLYDLADEVTEELNEKRYSKKKTEKTDNAARPDKRIFVSGTG